MLIFTRVVDKLAYFYNGEEVQLLVDNGATVSVLTKEIVDLIIKRNPKAAVLPVS